MASLTRDRFCTSWHSREATNGKRAYFVGWGAPPLNAGLARAKGRSGLLWWLFSLLLGPIATFLIVVLPKVERQWER